MENVLILPGSNAQIISREASPEPIGLDDGIRTERRWGILIIVLFFGLFLGWAAFARLDAAALATGTISVSGNRQVVQHRDGGIVSALRVREGQRVKAGDILIELSSAEAVATERSLSAQLIQAQAVRARLLAETTHTALQPSPEFAALTGVERAEADRAMTLQRAELGARQRAIGDQRSVLGQQAAQLSEQITGIGRRIDSENTQNKLFADELKGMRELEARGFASKNRVRELERSAAEINGQIGSLSASAAATRAQIGQTQMQALSVESDAAKRNSEDLRTIEASINDLLPRYRAAREQLELTRIRATASGQVVGLAVSTVGGVITPGQKLMEIVPDAAPLVVEAQIAPSDADDLHAGQHAEIQVGALHDRSLPILSGTLTRISADAFRDERTGQLYYTATFSVPAADIRAIHQLKAGGDGLKAGLPAEVLVPLRRRTLLQYLMEPLHQALWRSFREH
jgi:HlyD family secretion protein